MKARNRDALLPGGLFQGNRFLKQNTVLPKKNVFRQISLSEDEVYFLRVTTSHYRSSRSLIPVVRFVCDLSTFRFPPRLLGSSPEGTLRSWRINRFPDNGGIPVRATWRTAFAPTARRGWLPRRAVPSHQPGTL